MLKAESNETSPWLTNGYAIADRTRVHCVLSFALLYRLVNSHVISIRW